MPYPYWFVALVRAENDPPLTPEPPPQRQRGIVLCHMGRVLQTHLRHQPAPVLRRHMSGIGQDVRLRVRFARGPGLVVGDAGMRLIAALLPAPVSLLVAVTRQWFCRGGRGAGGPSSLSSDSAAGFGWNDL